MILVGNLILQQTQNLTLEEMLIDSSHPTSAKSF